MSNKGVRKLHTIVCVCVGGGGGLIILKILYYNDIYMYVANLYMYEYILL